MTSEESLDSLLGQLAPRRATENPGDAPTRGTTMADSTGGIGGFVHPTDISGSRSDWSWRWGSGFYSSQSARRSRASSSKGSA